MNTFHFFSRAHSDFHNDSDMGSVPLHTPWEIHPQPTINITPTTFWQFDQQQQQQPVSQFGLVQEKYYQPVSQFGLVEEKYYHGQTPWILPVKSSELDPIDGYMAPINSSTRKALHNAREQERRKVLRRLYSQLRSLLPNQNLKRKLSIPNTVCRALKYIPELRNQIRKLNRERTKLLDSTKRSIPENSVVTSKSACNTGAEGLTDLTHAPLPPAALGSPEPIVTVNAALWSSQMMITISNCRVGLLFSRLLVLFEKEGLDVLDASTFKCQDKVCFNLHLEILAGRSKVDTNFLQKKLVRLVSDITTTPNVLC